MIKKIKLLVITVVLLLGLTGFVMYEMSGEPACHVHAQGQEEEGNPNHTEPSQHCNTKPKDGQVACKCRRICNSDGTSTEDRKCRSFCFRHWCTCPDTCA